MPAHSGWGMTVTVMHSSGQFDHNFAASVECAECGTIVDAKIRVEPEQVLKYVFECPACGIENRPDLDEDDPDQGSDDE